jgi:hypothetical protein
MSSALERWRVGRFMNEGMMAQEVDLETVEA